MVRQVFITDCEGPLTLNDNAYEIAAEYIEDGDKLFKIISRFDDYLADELKKPGYHAGDTLKLIVPFFKLAGLANRDLIKFSREHIYLVEGSKEMLSLANDLMDAYIVSTSSSRRSVIIWIFLLKIPTIPSLIWMDLLQAA